MRGALGPGAVDVSTRFAPQSTHTSSTIRPQTPTGSRVAPALRSCESTAMSGSRERKRQKKLEKSRKKREAVRRDARRQERGLPQTASGLIRAAADAPFGPAWITESLDESDTALVTAIVTRRLRGGVLLPALALVDRTCLGVKNGFVMEPAEEYEMARRVASISEKDPLRPCEPLLAQSVVFHALDYADALGFIPHKDFDVRLFLPRPERLLDTRGANRPRPYYLAGPYDRVEAILRQLDRAVGRGNYDFSAPEHLLPGFLTDDDDSLDDEAFGDKAFDGVYDLLPNSADGAIDWAVACSNAPSEELLEGIDLDDDAGLEDAVQSLVEALETDFFLDWEAVLRVEQDLPLSKAHARALRTLLLHRDEPDEGEDTRILYIDDCARPAEPWYETVRRVAPRIVGRFDRIETLGARLLEAIEHHAAHLSLPEGAERPEDVLPADLRKRMDVEEELVIVRRESARSASKAR